MVAQVAPDIFQNRFIYTTALYSIAPEPTVKTTFIVLKRSPRTRAKSFDSPLISKRSLKNDLISEAVVDCKVYILISDLEVLKMYLRVLGKNYKM